MPPVQKQTYKSPGQSYSAGNTLRFHGWVPVYGPNGGINVIDELEFVTDFASISFDVSATEGEDVWRAIERVVVEQVDGVQRCNLQGDELRHYCYLSMGADRVPEYADVADADTQALVWAFPFPLEQRYSRRPKEYSLPAELLKEVRFTCGLLTSAGLGVGGATVTMPGAGTVYVLAHCHEEFAVARKVALSVMTTPFPSTSGLTLKIGGRLRTLAIVKRAATGGTSMANFTSARIDGLMPEPLNRTPDLKWPYLRSRGASMNDPNSDGGGVHNDPVIADKSVPIIWADEDSSSFDGPLVDEVMLRATNTVSDCLALTEVVLPASDQVRTALERRHGIGPGEWKVKTESKTRRSPSAWSPDKADFIEQTAPLKRRGLVR